MCDCVRSVLIGDCNPDSFQWSRLHGSHAIEECSPSGVDDFRVTTSFRWTIKSDTVLSTSTDQIDVLLDGLPLRLHLDRLRSSVHAFGWTRALEVLQADSVERIVRSGLLKHIELATAHGLSNAPKHPHISKIRLTVSKDGKLEIQGGGGNSLKPPIYPFTFDSSPFSEGLPRDSILARVIVARTPTEPSLFTKHKTTHRSMYVRAYHTVIQGMLAPTTAEVLLYNMSDEIMEASVSTAYFQHGSTWITPASSCGGNLGTTRRWALQNGWCEEGVVTLSDVKNMHGETIWLSNAVRGFWPAKLCLDLEEWGAHQQHPQT